MASTYTPLGVEIQATGENAGTWGTKTNVNLQILEQISGGFIQKSIAGSAQTSTLVVQDGATGAELAHRMIEFTGTITGNQIVTIPNDIQQLYFIKNSTSGAYTVQFKYATGSGDSFTFSATDKGTKILFASGNPDTTNPKIIEVSTGSDVVDDTTPQLGGNLDTNSHNILFDDAHFIADENGNEQIIFQTTSSAVNQIDVTNAATGNAPSISATGDDSNIDLALIPKGTGETKVGTGAAAATVTSSGAYDLVLDTNSGTNSGNITITDGADGNITATPNGTGVVVAGGNTNPGTLQLNCESNSHGIKLQSPPHSSAQSYTLKFPTSDVTAGTFLKVDSVSGSGATGVGQLAFAGAGGTSWQAVKTANFSAAAGEGYFVDTSGGAITATLPASPSIGDTFTFKDYAQNFGTNKLLIDPNGNKFEGLDDQSHECVQNRQAVEITFVDSTKGYVLTGAGNSTAGFNSGNFNIVPPVYTCSFLCIAAGGGGGGSHGGGAGGAGGYRSSYAGETSGGGGSAETALSLTPGTTYTVTIGGGSTGSKGGDSSITGVDITDITSAGGGRGGQGDDLNGGSGAGAQGHGHGNTAIQGGTGTANQGNNGGAGSGGGTYRTGGGGGGAANAGQAGTLQGSAGTGGNGVASSITGTSTPRAGGGGGGAQSGGSTSGAQGGTGGGGNGARNQTANAGTANTGGGAGAHEHGGPAGGSGVVVLRMATSDYSGTTTGSPTVSTTGGDTVIVFNSSGSYTA